METTHTFSLSAFFVLFFGVIAAFLVVSGFIAYGFYRSYKGSSNRKFLKNKTIIPQYTPPVGLTPAETGLLYDGKIGRLELYATIYDLKVRKFVSLQNEAGALAAITLLRYEPGKLTSYEDLVMRFLFHDGRSVRLSDITNNGEYNDLQAYLTHLCTQTLQAKGYLFFNDEYVQVAYRDSLQKSLNDMLDGSFVPDLFTGYAKFYTPQATDILDEIEGFKQFITTADLDRLQSQISGDVAEYIERTAPYAIVFNELERWRLISFPLFIFTPVKSLHFETAEEREERQNPWKAAIERQIASIDTLDSYRVSAQ